MSAWAFGFRIWAAVVIALGTSFWLELEAPSSAALTVAILAIPTRGQVLEKATFRLIATAIGVAASIALVGIFSQTRDLLLAAFAVWLGLCIYAAGLLDGSRAYAAVLSGYTVALVAIQQIDNPQHVFETCVARGAAIVVGILSLAVVNELLAAPDGYPQFASRLAALHRRVRAYAKAPAHDQSAAAATTAGLLRELAALHPDMTSLVAESSSGSIRSAAARSTAVALVAELQAARALDALSSAADPAFGAWLASALDSNRGECLEPSFAAWTGGAQPPAPDHSGAALEWATGELLRRDDEVRQGLAALESGARPPRVRRAPLYRAHRIAAEAGGRAAVHFALASALLVMGGWPAADASLSLVAVIIGLGATVPSPHRFTAGALIGAPVAVLLTGVLEFIILNGVTEFPLLAIALAPFMIGSTVLMTLPHMTLSALGRFNLIFILAILSPSNPQTYDPQLFLFTALFLFLAVASLFAFQILIPPISQEHNRRWLMASARSEFDDVLSRRDRRYLPEEAMYRDATRIAQLVAAGGSAAEQRADLEQALAYFDQAAMIRLCGESLTRLEGGRLGAVAAEARSALVQCDSHLIRAAAADLTNAAASDDDLARTTSGALILAARMIDAAPQRASGTRGLPVRSGPAQWQGAEHARAMELET